MNRLNKSSQAYLIKRLNFRYAKVISDVENNQVNDFTRELAREYNEMVLDNPKYQSRMLFNIDSLKTYFKPEAQPITLQFNQ